MKLRILIEDFLFHCEVERGLSENTVDSYGHDLNQFTLFVPDQATVKQALCETQLKLFLTDMSRRRKLSSSTVRRRLACLKALARYASERHGVLNPFKNWSPRIKRAKRLPKVLPKSDVAKLLSSHNGDGDPEIRFILMVIGVTGLRISELCALRAKDVSTGGDVMRVHGKGAKDRVVYLTHRSVKNKMRERRAARISEFGETGRIFLNSRGNPLMPQTLRRRLHKFAQHKGYDRTVTPHMFRHTAATLLIEQGADIRFVQKLLGHASISTTEIYTHVSNEALRSAVSKANTLDAVFKAEAKTNAHVSQ